jgi:hypothetical protein
MSGLLVFLDGLFYVYYNYKPYEVFVHGMINKAILIVYLV